MTPKPNANDAKATVPLPNAAPTGEAETVPLAGDARATVPLPGGAADVPTPTAPPAKIGRFEVRAHLGSGAFGDVYRAYDPQLDRDVAIKVAKPGTLDTPERAARFLREAKSAANLRHPNIVPLYETGRDGDRLFIASAFIAGRTLEAIIQDANDRPLTLLQRVEPGS
jgi:hypothetical protein